MTPTSRTGCAGKRGDAVYLSLTVYGGPRDGGYSERIVGTVNDRDHLDIAADGSFELMLARARPTGWDGPFLQLEDDAVVAITRDYLEDPFRGQRCSWHIEAIDPPATVRQTDADVARRFRAALKWVEQQAAMVPLALGEPNQIDEPYGVQQVTFGWAAGDAAYAMGSFDLAPDEALVITGRSPECAFWNCCLWNQFLHTYNYDYENVTINGAQAQLRARWLVATRRRVGGSGRTELAVDPGPPARSHLVPLVLSVGDTRPSEHRGRESRLAASLAASVNGRQDSRVTSKRSV